MKNSKGVNNNNNNRVLKILWNMKMTIIQIAYGPLGMASKNMENRLGELEIRRIETN